VSHETIAAAKTIRSILASVDDHGVIDVFSKYPTQDLLASVFALSRIQSACRQFEKSNFDRDIDDNSCLPDEDLVDDLLYYAPFATAAYGWKMDLATAGRIHRGDRNALVKMTKIDLDDIVSVSWESRTNRPVRVPLQHSMCTAVLCTFRLKREICCNAGVLHRP
jgi:hypothetical protein